MHRAILDRAHRASSPVSLSFYPSSRGGLIAAFSSRSSGPEWVAKASERPEIVARVKKEHDALRYLEPWADELGIPRVLAWDQGSEAACLIITGAEGTPEFPRLRIGGTDIAPDALFHTPFAWLARFQKLVPPPPSTGFRQVLDEWLHDLEFHPHMGAVADGLRAALQACEPPEWPRPVTVHGDFAACNVLRTATGVTVIDWESFGAGFPFQDVFTFVCAIPCYDGQRPCTLLEQYRHALFSISPVCRYVERYILRNGAHPRELRFAFYGFLAAHLRTQTALPPQQWLELFDYLAARGYPAPCTPLEG